MVIKYIFEVGGSEQLRSGQPFLLWTYWWLSRDPSCLLILRSQGFNRLNAFPTINKTSLINPHLKSNVSLFEYRFPFKQEWHGKVGVDRTSSIIVPSCQMWVRAPWKLAIVQARISPSRPVIPLWEFSGWIIKTFKEKKLSNIYIHLVASNEFKIDQNWLAYIFGHWKTSMPLELQWCYCLSLMVERCGREAESSTGLSLWCRTQTRLLQAIVGLRTQLSFISREGCVASAQVPQSPSLSYDSSEKETAREVLVLLYIQQDSKIWKRESEKAVKYIMHNAIIIIFLFFFLFVS